MVVASVRASEFGRFGFVRAFLGFAIGVTTLFPITYSPLPLFLPSFPPTWAAHICRAVRQGVYISTDRPQRDEWQNMCHIRYLQIWFRHPYVGLLVMAEPPLCEAGVTAHETQVFFNAGKHRMLKQYQPMHGSSGVL